jgi:hypothetical protein
MRTLTDSLALILVVLLIVLLTVFDICGNTRTGAVLSTLSTLLAVYTIYRVEVGHRSSRSAAQECAAVVRKNSQNTRDGFAAAPDTIAGADVLENPFSYVYPGTIWPDENILTPSDPAYASGARDKYRGENADAPLGNFYNFGRTAAPESAGPCADGEANGDFLDADEQNTYQVRSRNDPVRITAGTMRRQRDLDRYLREEVLEAEVRMWWGRGEI